ncbi:MAG: hypothetical protein WCT01_02365 [Candidatus Shapirobacteria bacterium]|jgi:hypothetical protein
MTSPLLINYPSTDKLRIENFLTKLLPYLNLPQAIFVGGLALGHYLGKNNIHLNRPFNDLDLVIPSLSAISPKAVSSGDFLVSHFHDYAKTNELTTPPRDRFYLVLVDPGNQIKIDIFDTEPFPPTSTVLVSFGGFSLNLASPQNLLCHLVWNAYGIINNEPIQAKMIPSITSFWPLVNLSLASSIWTEFYSFTVPLKAVWEKIQNASQSHPQLLKEKFFHRSPTSAPCPSCLKDSSWPLTPQSEIYRLMGYLE